MDMAAKFQEQVVFHVTGRNPGGGLAAVDGATLRPALLAGYRDLGRLRYDFPLVLVEGPQDASCLQSLSAIVNRVLGVIAPRGLEGERLRRHVLRLEREIRTRAAAGEGGTLTAMWASAAAQLAGDDATVEQVLMRAAAALDVDGEVVDCDGELPRRVLVHAWRAVQVQKARRFESVVGGLVRSLTDILRAAFIRSEAGRRPESLRASLGAPHHEVFDFEVLSRLLGRAGSGDELPPARRQRIEWAIGVLQQRTFYPRPAVDAPEDVGGVDEASRPGAATYLFDDCGQALEAFRMRLPGLVEFVKAMSIAVLEADGRYVEASHDPFFERFGDAALTPGDLALFPDYLVCGDGARGGAEDARLMEVLASDLPIKVLVPTGDVLEESSLGAGHFGFGMRSTQLASTAMGFSHVFVLQAASSSLYPLRERLLRGLAYRGPALFSVFTGSATPAGRLPTYLTAAAAMESRAFAAFTHDPSAGSDWASRFSLEDNPQPELDWPIRPLEYADDALQRVREQVAFTVVDFAACDRRFAGHFALLPRQQWNASQIPADEWLAKPPAEVADRVPYVLAVDDHDVLHRLLVDARLMQAARRCREAWQRLQELGGIHNSHAERRLASERAAWEAERGAAAAGADAAPAATAAGSAAAVANPPGTAADAAVAPAATASSDDPWIETARCPSCNECQNINDRMFAYNENKQAYIKDPDAGTFRQLVEAAESCQVAIIHPGKPRNPAEPGVEELLARAAVFA